jgi:hypothetical protein
MAIYLDETMLIGIVRAEVSYARDTSNEVEEEVAFRLVLQIPDDLPMAHARPPRAAFWVAEKARAHRHRIECVPTPCQFALLRQSEDYLR